MVSARYRRVACDIRVDLGRLLQVRSLDSVHRVRVPCRLRIVDGDVVRDLGVGGLIRQLGKARGFLMVGIFDCPMGCNIVVDLPGLLQIVAFVPVHRVRIQA